MIINLLYKDTKSGGGNRNRERVYYQNFIYLLFGYFAMRSGVGGEGYPGTRGTVVMDLDNKHGTRYGQ